MTGKAPETDPEKKLTVCSWQRQVSVELSGNRWQDLHRQKSDAPAP